jgi:hypothetical protein
MRQGQPYSFTINTDASHSPRHGGVGSWACWIKSSHYKIKEAKLCEGPVANSSVAEAIAVEQALMLLDLLINSQEFLLDQREKNGIHLYINTDSAWVIQALNGNIKRSKHLDIARRIRSLVEGFTVDVRHVKAHTKNTDARSWVNRWCDKQAHSLVSRKVKELDGRTKKV